MIIDSLFHDSVSVNSIVKPRVVLPLAVVRIAGISHRAFRRLEFSEAFAVGGHCLEAEEAAGEHAKLVLPLLETLIGSTTDISVRRDLISLRRDVFNDRLPGPELISRIREQFVSTAIRNPNAVICEWIDKRIFRHSLSSALDSSLSAELIRKRATLVSILRSPGFSRALAIASPSLSAEILPYVSSGHRTGVTCPMRVERSLMNYLCRSSFKLSPFSSFTISGLADLNPSSRGCMPEPYHVHRHVAINQALLSTFAFHISQYEEFRDRVLVHLSQSILWTDNLIRVVRHRYDHSSPSRSRVPRESLPTLPNIPELQHLRQILGGSAISASEMLIRLKDICASDKDGRDLLNLLVDFGIVGLSLSRAEQSVSCSVLLEFLAASSTPRTAELQRLIAELMVISDQFSTAAAPRRRVLLRLLDETVSTIYRALEIPAPKSWTGLLLYEDVVVSKTQTVPDLRTWNHPLKDLQNLVTVISPLLDGNSSVRETLLRILRTDFSGQPTPLLTIMERYSKTLEKAVASSSLNVRDYTPNALALAPLQALADVRREFGAAVSETSDLEEIDFKGVIEKKCWAERVADLCLVPPVTEAIYTCCYCQPVRSLGRDQLIVNKFHSGPFRSTLRVCGALPAGDQRDQTLEELRTLIQDVYKDAEPCEIRANFDFNVNCQPCITDTVINYTGRSVPGVTEVSLGDLMLSERDDDRLMLSSILAPERPLAPLTFGLMATVFQPPVEYVLLSLGARDPFVYRPFDPCSWNMKGTESDPILRYPRLRYGDCILRRRGWAIRYSMLPKRESNESESTCFTRVLRWKRQLQLPDEVYVRARTFEECMQAPNEAKQRKRILHKPQYLHFANYFLVDSFLALCVECESYMYIEEALPGSSDWDSFSTRRAIEVVVDVQSCPAVVKTHPGD